MAAKGAIVKEEIMTKILEIFPESFVADKDIRVNMVENGNPVQIKISFTAVKSPISDNPKINDNSEGEFSLTEVEEADLVAMLEEMGVS